MIYLKTLLGIFFFTTSLPSQTLSPAQLLEKSIQYHDPNGVWATQKHDLELKETRPNASDRETSVVIDLTNSFFEIDQIREGKQILRQVKEEACTHRLDNSEKITPEEVEAHQLTCERTQLLRNYYTYLWGLPMKLKDPGTILDGKIQETSFMEQACYAIKVSYNPEVGKDIWYFYFDKNTAAMIGYRFYHDESKNDGEYITLEGEATTNGMRLPKTRKWFVNKDDKFLGADILLNNE